MLFRSTIPKALIASIDVSPRPATLTNEAGAWKFAQPDHVELRGLGDLTNPAEDPLPQNAQDARVVDQDEDGNPGVTVFVDVSATNLEVWVVQRIVTRLDADVGEDGGFQGMVTWSEEQVILGGVDDEGKPSSILDALLVQPGITPTKDESRFRMTRVDADLTAGEAADICEAVLADKGKWGW